MPRNIPVGNGSLLVTHDHNYCLRDIFFPSIGKENHTGGHGLRLGIWVDNVFAWMGRDWHPQFSYVPESLISEVKASHDALAVELNCHDVVDYRENIYIKKIVLRNRQDSDRSFRIFFHEDFHILESPAGDTVYFDPDEKALIHYKADRYFLTSGMRHDLVGIDQYATGVKEFQGKEGTWRDAEDGWLEGNPIAQGSVDSVLSFWIDVPGREERTLYYWIAAGKDYVEVSRLNQLLIVKTPEFIIRRTEEYWRAWVNKEEFNLEVLPPAVIDLFKKSLLIMRTNVDAGGAIIAASDSDAQSLIRDTYAYMWPRDGAFTAYALDLAGYIGVTRNFFRFCLDIISKGKEAGGYFLHKYHPDGSLGSSWHPWIMDGGQKRLPIQEDGTGLVLWALWHHFDKYRDVELSARIYEVIGNRCGDFLASYRDQETGLPLPSYGLWEETWGVHTFTVAAVYAGLTAAANFARFFGEREKARSYQDAAREVKAAMEKHLYSREHKRFLRKVVPREDGYLQPDALIDASLYGPFYFGVFGARDEMVVNTMTAIKKQLWVKSEVGGIARYEGDSYHRSTKNTADIPGNPWFICTLWLAQWYIARAENLKDLQEAIPIIEWVTARAMPTGVLAEQVDPFTDRPLSVSPLTWSHATYVATVLEYLHKLEEVYLCPTCGRSMYRHDRGGREQHKGKEWVKIHQIQEKELGRSLTYAQSGIVEYQSRRARISVNHTRCVGATMCAFSCPAAIFELVHDKAQLVVENLPKCLLQTCLNCRNNCPTNAVSIVFTDENI